MSKSAYTQSSWLDGKPSKTNYTERSIILKEACIFMILRSITNWLKT